MNEENTIKLKKQIIYRCTYTGTKETDYLFKKYIIDKIDEFNKNELYFLNELLENYSDQDIILFINKKKLLETKYKILLKKINS
tara:strand:- start:400 stop:651 length:252 start_codon:yes stop_codon:yes gene_type:complete